MADISERELLEAQGPDALALAAFHDCWREGDLSFFCSQIQIEARGLVYEHPSRRVVWETNRRFGKTRTAVVTSGETCLAFPGVRIPYAAPTATQVRAFVHPPMLELANSAPPELAPEIVRGEWVFPPLQWLDATGNPVRTKLHGGVELARFKGTKAAELLCMSRVAPHGCEDHKKADALRGTGTVFAVLDEVRDIPIAPYVIKQVIGPMLWEARSRWHSMVKATMLVASTPPDEPDHPFIEIADAAQAKGAYFHATVYECDHLDERAIEEAIEEAGGEDSVEWQVEGLAKRVRDPKRVVLPEWGDHLIGEWTRPEYFLPHIIGDMGFVDWTVMLFGYYDFAQDMAVIEREVAGQKMLSTDLDDEVRKMQLDLWGPRAKVHRRRIDSTARERADLSDEDYQGEESEEGERVHWQAVSRDGGERKGRMRALANRLRVRCKAKKLRIHPSCKITIAHCDAARWDAAQRTFARVKDENGNPLHHFDGCAAACYFDRDLDTLTNPYPKLPPGVSDITHYIPPELRPEHKNAKLRKIFGRQR